MQFSGCPQLVKFEDIPVDVQRSVPLKKTTHDARERTMTKIKKIKLFNFKRFAKETFEFNDDINIFVGDNDSGKSSLLEAIDLCLNGTHRGKPLSPELMSELFNNQCVDTYLGGNRAQDTLILPHFRGHLDMRFNSSIEVLDEEQESYPR
jgi:predicted ATPase